VQVDTLAENGSVDNRQQTVHTEIPLATRAAESVPSTDVLPQAAGAVAIHMAAEATEPLKTRWGRGQLVRAGVGVYRTLIECQYNVNPRLVPNRRGIMELLVEGLSPAQVAAALEMHISVVSRTAENVLTIAARALAAGDVSPQFFPDGIPQPPPKKPRNETPGNVGPEVQRYWAVTSTRSVEEVAAELEVDPATVYRCLRGITHLPVNTFRDLLEAIGMPPDDASRMLNAYRIERAHKFVKAAVKAKATKAAKRSKQPS
jgi:hypothetical protein